MKLKIYGSDHRRQKACIDLAKKDIDKLILLEEGKTLDLTKQTDSYGVEDELLSCYGLTLKSYIYVFGNIPPFIQSFNKLELLEEKQIPSFITQLDKLIASGSQQYVNPRKDFTEVIIQYVQNIFYLAFECPMRDEIVKYLSQNNLIEIVVSYSKKYQEFMYGDPTTGCIDISKFDSNFFQIFFDNKDNFNSFLKGILLPKFLEEIKTKYANVANIQNLSTDKLNAFFADPNSKAGNEHADEILINLRNHAICNNILLILNTNEKKLKDFVFIVGQEHIAGLKDIFTSKVEECKKLNLTIEYFNLKKGKEIEFENGEVFSPANTAKKESTGAEILAASLTEALGTKAAETKKNQPIAATEKTLPTKQPGSK